MDMDPERHVCLPILLLLICGGLLVIYCMYLTSVHEVPDIRAFFLYKKLISS